MDWRWTSDDFVKSDQQKHVIIMYKVTYLDRSGFIVVNNEAILVFDYYSDPSHALHRTLENNPEKPVIFFVNYHVGAHLNKSIFELAQNHQRTYVMSNDVYPQNVPDTLSVAGMSKGDIIEGLPGDIKVKAYGTSGKGVAFLVTDKKKKNIFHAGALDDPQVVEKIKEEKADSQCSVGVAVNRIAEEVNVIDIAFLPADTDTTSHVARHALQFLNEIKVANLFPIHLGSGNKETSDFKAYEVNGTTVHYLREPGQSLTLE